MYLEVAGSWQSGVTNEPLGYWLITEGGWNLFFFPKVYREIIWKVTHLKFASLTTPFSSLNHKRKFRNQRTGSFTVLFPT